MTPSAPHDVDRLRRALARAGSEPTSDPVDPEQLWRAVRGRAEPAEVAALAERMAHDAALAEEWRLAAAFASAEDEGAAEHDSDGSGSPSATPEPANRGEYARWGSVVAALVAAAVLLVVAWPRSDVVLPAGDPGAMRGTAGGITALQGEGPLARDQATLAWSPVPGAMRYELYVSTPALEPVLTERALASPSAVLPAAILRPLPAGTELLWRVEAVLDDEQRVVSPTFFLTVSE